MKSRKTLELEESLLRNLRLQYRFSQLFGCPMYRIWEDRLGNLYCSILNRQKLKAVLKFVLSCGLFSPAALFWYSASKGDEMITSVIDKFQVGLMMGCASLSFVMQAIRVKVVRKMMRQISLVEKVLRLNNAFVDHGELKKVFVLTSIIPLLIASFVEVIDWRGHMEHRRYQRGIFVTCYYIAVVIVNAADGQFVFMLSILRNQFRALNDHLESLCKEVGLVSESALKVSQSVYQNRIKEAFKIHLNILETCCMLNIAYDIFHFFKLPLLCLCLSNHFFYTYTSYINEPKYKLRHLCLLVSWSSVYIFQLMFIFYATDKTVSEAKRSINIISKHFMKTNRKFMLPAIRFVTIQSVRQKLTFKVCGVFNIDLPFLNLMLTTTCTYIVMLIQFYGSGSE